MSRLKVKTPVERKAKNSKLSLIRAIVWPLPLALAAYFFYKAISMAKNAGCQLGETCIDGEGLLATNYAAAAVAISVGFALVLALILLWKVASFILHRAQSSRKKTGTAI